MFSTKSPHHVVSPFFFFLWTHKNSKINHNTRTAATNPA
ncbi:hypothetical protein CU001_1306 [Enterococcus faecium]|nr:hypothetical protein [Enterococcus faecium]